MRDKFIKAVRASASMSFLAGIIGFLSAGLALKVYDTNILGLIQLVQAILFLSVGILGLPMINTGIVQYFSNKENKTEKIIESSLGYIIIIYLSIIFMLVLLTIFESNRTTKNPYFINYKDFYIMLLVILSSFLEQVNLILNSKVISNNLTFAIYIDKGNFILSQLLLIILINYSKDINLYLAMILIFGIIKFLILYINCSIEDKKMIRPIFDIKIIKILPYISKSSYLGSLVSILNSYGDKILLYLYGGLDNLPIYNLAQSATSFLHQLIYSISYPFFPLLSAEGERGKIKARSIDSRQRFVIISLGCFVYSISIILVPTTILLINNNINIQLFTTFVILSSIQGYLVCISLIPIFGLLALNERKILATIEWCTGLLILLLSLLLGSLYGALGVAISRLGYITQSILSTEKYTSLLNFKSINDKFGMIMINTLIILTSIIYSIFKQSFIISKYSIIVDVIFIVFLILLWYLLQLLTRNGKINLEFIRDSIKELIMRK